MSDTVLPSCPMPDCGQDLYITWETAYNLNPADLADVRAIPVGDYHVGTWKVECLDGHVILLPGPPGCCERAGEPGCEHNEDDYDWGDDTRTFRPHDAQRLRDLLTHLAGNR